MNTCLVGGDGGGEKTPRPCCCCAASRGGDAGEGPQQRAIRGGRTGTPLSRSDQPASLRCPPWAHPRRHPRCRHPAPAHTRGSMWETRSVKGLRRERQARGSPPCCRRVQANTRPNRHPQPLSTRQHKVAQASQPASLQRTCRPRSARFAAEDCRPAAAAARRMSGSLLAAAAAAMLCGERRASAGDRRASKKASSESGIQDSAAQQQGPEVQ